MCIRRCSPLNPKIYTELVWQVSAVNAIDYPYEISDLLIANKGSAIYEYQPEKLKIVGEGKLFS